MEEENPDSYNDLTGDTPQGLSRCLKTLTFGMGFGHEPMSVILGFGHEPMSVILTFGHEPMSVILGFWLEVNDLNHLNSHELNTYMEVTIITSKLYF
jgi:hypothetical protein